MQRGIHLGGYSGESILAGRFEPETESKKPSSNAPTNPSIGILDTIPFSPEIQALLDPIKKQNFLLALEQKKLERTHIYIKDYFRNAGFYSTESDFEALKAKLKANLISDKTLGDEEFTEALQILAIIKFKNPSKGGEPSSELSKDFHKSYESLDSKIANLQRKLTFLFEDMVSALIKKSEQTQYSQPLNQEEKDLVAMFETFWNARVLTENRQLDEKQIATIEADHLLATDVFKKMYATYEKIKAELKTLTEDVETGLARISAQTKTEDAILKDTTKNYLTYEVDEKLSPPEKVKTLFDEYIGGYADILKHPFRSHSAMATQVINKMTSLMNREIDDAAKTRQANSYLVRIKKLMFFTGQLEVKEEPAEQKEQPKPETSYLSWMASGAASYASALWQSALPQKPSSFWRRLNMCLRVYVRVAPSPVQPSVSNSNMTELTIGSSRSSSPRKHT